MQHRPLGRDGKGEGGEGPVGCSSQVLLVSGVPLICLPPAEAMGHSWPWHSSGAGLGFPYAPC